MRVLARSTLPACCCQSDGKLPAFWHTQSHAVASQQLRPGALDPELAHSQLEGASVLSVEPGSDIGITRPLSPMESFQSFYSYAWRIVVRSAVREREYRRGVASKGGRSRENM